MGESISEHLRECLEHAARCEALAKETSYPAAKAEYILLARRWRFMARSAQLINLANFDCANPPARPPELE
jgi:hypothetical protein